MQESYHQQIEEKQRSIEALQQRLPGDAKNSLEQTKSVFIHAVDAFQQDITNLWEGFSGSELEAFKNSSINKVHSHLTLVTLDGFNYLKKLEKSKDPNNQTPSPEDEEQNFSAKIEQHAARLNQTLNSIQKELELLEDLKKATLAFHDVETKEAEWSERMQKNPTPETIAEGQNLIQALENVKISLPKSANSLLGNQTIVTLKADIEDNQKIISEKIALPILLEDPEQYTQLIEANLDRTLASIIDDPNVVTQEKQKILGALQPSLNELTNAKGNKEAAIKQKEIVNARIEELLQNAPCTYLNVPGREGMYTCHYDPPEKYSNYENLKQEAQSAMAIFLDYRDSNPMLDDVDFENVSFMNGVLSCQIDQKESDEYCEITATADQINVRTSNLEHDKKRVQANSFANAFEEWRKSPEPGTTITFGIPPQTVDVGSYMGNKHKTEVTLTNILNAMKQHEVNQHKQPPEVLKDLLYNKEGQPLVDIEDVYTYGSSKDSTKNLYRKASKEWKILNPRNTTIREFTEDGELLKKTIEDSQLYNREVRNTKIIEEYYTESELPPDSASAVKKKTQKINNGIIIESTDYDKEQNAVKQERGVDGCPGMVSIVYANGKPIFDKKGNLLPDTVRTLYIAEKEGKIIKILPYSVIKKENPTLTKQEYMQQLANVLTTDERVHFYIHTAFKYTDKNERKGEYRSNYEEILDQENNQLYEDDCDGYAEFIAEIKRSQGKQPYLVGVDADDGTNKGHAATIVIEKTEDGLFNAVSYDTTGVDRNGNRVGKPIDPIKTKGYPTIEEALASLNPKWKEYHLTIFKNNGKVTLLENIPETQNVDDVVEAKINLSYIEKFKRLGENYKTNQERFKDQPWRSTYWDYNVDPTELKFTTVKENL